MYLKHYGIKGQRWGNRRYQNEDGTLTEEGKKRYNSVFISGSSKTTDPNSEYYRKELPNEVMSKLDDYIKKNNNIIVGDAPGIDTQVQEYLNNKNYKNVSVYTTSKHPRHLANEGWNIHVVDTHGLDPNSKEGLKMKDIAMTNDAEKGFAVILENGGAGATRKNVKRLIDQKKDVEVFMLKTNDKDQYVKNIVEELYKGGIRIENMNNIDQEYILKLIHSVDNDTISHANPYHDEDGKFTTAENAAYADSEYMGKLDKKINYLTKQNTYKTLLERKQFIEEKPSREQKEKIEKIRKELDDTLSKVPGQMSESGSKFRNAGKDLKDLSIGKNGSVIYKHYPSLSDTEIRSKINRIKSERELSDLTNATVYNKSKKEKAAEIVSDFGRFVEIAGAVASIVLPIAMLISKKKQSPVIKNSSFDEDDENVLKHYGVLGMKWGVINKKEINPEKSKYSRQLEIGKKSVVSALNVAGAVAFGPVLKLADTITKLTSKEVYNKVKDYELERAVKKDIPGSDSKMIKYIVGGRSFVKRFGFGFNRSSSRT